MNENKNTGFDQTGRRTFTNSKVRELLETHFSSEKGLALEVACGAGVYANYLQEHGFQVDAFDINAKSIEVAKEKYSSDIHFFAMNVEDMHTIHKSYDLVLDWGLLDLYGPTLAEKRKYFEQVFRVLKPGGVFALFCFNVKSFGYSKPGTRVRIDKKGGEIYFTPLNELTSLLQNQFEILNAQLVTAEHIDKFPALGNWIIVRK